MSDTQLLKKNIAKHITLSSGEMDLFVSSFKTKHLKKKEYLLKQGDICKFEAFVKKGCFSIYHLDEKGFKHILYFAVEDWWVGDIDSFMNQTSAYLYIEALENSEILFIDKKAKEDLYVKVPAIERMFRIMGQKTHVAMQRRMVGILSKAADERYADFLVKYPNIAQRISNLQLAAYLGISHEFLSKIRSKIIKAKK